jgi:DNA-binding NarL/FixJ family response regulator
VTDADHAVAAGIHRADTRLSTKVARPMSSATTANLAHPEDPADGLAAVVALRRLADRMEDAQVERALRDGWTWAEVAEALGVTRQAVHKKHARRLRDV